MNKKIIGGVAAALVAVVAYMFVANGGSNAAETSNADLPDYLVDRVLGDENAPVTVMEYANFTCSHCRDFHETVFGELKAEYIDTGKVRFVYREIYTDGPGVLAGSLARCLPANQYFGMADILFENQATWAFEQTTIDGVKAELQKYAAVAGLGADALTACFDDTERQEEMLAHTRANADRDKIKGTPSVYVNGKSVDNWAWANLKSEIDAALN